MDALEHFWCPLRADDELLPYLEGTWGEPVTVEALAGLLAAERQAFDQAMARPVWICVGLGPMGMASRGWWVRPDWPLWIRVVDPEGEQAPLLAAAAAIPRSGDPQRSGKAPDAAVGSACRPPAGAGRRRAAS